MSGKMKTKRCTKCKKQKSLVYFPNNKNNKDGKHWWCKVCNYQNTRKWSDFDIKKRPWINSYNNAKQRCNNPNNPNYPWYGKRGIKFLLTKSECDKLWNRDKAEDMKFPTIDRINNNGHYEYTNCQFIENTENSLKDSFGHIYNGEFIEYYQIAQYDQNGNLIKIWRSQGEIAKKLKINQGDISYFVNGKLKRGHPLKSLRGFIWRKHKLLKEAKNG
jgi:hypothetical protein